MDEKIQQKENDTCDVSNRLFLILVVIGLIILSVVFYFTNLQREDINSTCERCYGEDWNTTVSKVSRGVYQYLCTNTKTLEWKYGSKGCYNNE
ncbi:MAG TPA: hypothetical protein VI911_09705 [Patescibacteria group bacterium]|nr:hypothetical protein [Patescibacteria group bacterium]